MKINFYQNEVPLWVDPAVNGALSRQAQPHMWEFKAELEEDDRINTKSLNAGNAEMSLAHDTARFYFPFKPIQPHPDLFTLGILKIFSPFVGSQITVPFGVSEQFSKIAESHYGFRIRPIDPNLKPREISIKKNYGVSFSGGADSVAASLVLPEGTVLINHTRCNHSRLPERERWYKPRANIQTLERMPSRFRKVVVHSDFEYLCWNGNYCVYPDSYAFAIPLIFLADHFDLTGVVTGDIAPAFTGDEVKFRPLVADKACKIFNGVGLDFFAPLAGVSEFGSVIINDYFGFQDIATSCSYGEFQSPCMKCLKCFRKSMIESALKRTQIEDKYVTSFSESPAVRKYVYGTGRKNITMIPTYKMALSMIPGTKKGIFADLERKVDLLDIDTSFELKMYRDSKDYGMGAFERAVLDKVEAILPEMNCNERVVFESIDTISFFKNSENFKRLSAITYE